MLDRKDIDAVVIGTPDHWHVPITIAAVRAGKDVYCEKPVTHSIAEGEPIIAAVRESKRIVQIGLQQRSWEHFAQAREEILDGRLGQVTLIRTYWYPEPHHRRGPRPLFDMSQARLEALPGHRLRPPLRCRSIRQLALVLGFRRRRHDRPVRPLGGCGPLDHGRRHAHARHRQRASRRSWRSGRRPTP